MTEGNNGFNWCHSPAALRPSRLRGIFAYSSKNFLLSYSLFISNILFLQNHFFSFAAWLLKCVIMMFQLMAEAFCHFIFSVNYNFLSIFIQCLNRDLLRTDCFYKTVRETKASLNTFLPCGFKIPRCTTGLPHRRGDWCDPSAMRPYAPGHCPQTAPYSSGCCGPWR